MRSLPWLMTALLISACSGPPPSDHPMPMDGTGPTLPSRPLEMGPVSHSARPLPPISGGTLATAEVDGKQVAVASEPEQDQIWIVREGDTKAKAHIDLEDGAEPGRVAIAGNRAFVALRRAGQLAVVDLTTNTLIERRALCPAPRGVDTDADADEVAVACMGGEVEILRASTLEPVASFRLARDLRDVVLRGKEVLLSRFRSSELVVLLRDDGTVRDQGAPAPQRAQVIDRTTGNPREAQVTPSVGWRLAPTPDGGAVMVHQRGSSDPVQITTPGGYGSSGSECGGIVMGSVSVVGRGEVLSSGGFAVALPVDVAASRQGQLAVATAANPPATGDNGGFDSSVVPSAPCGESPRRPLLFNGPSLGGPTPDANQAQVVQGVAVAFDKSSSLLVQKRFPRGVMWGGEFHAFDEKPDLRDTGHQIFHMDSGSGLACASCHPEGGDDGRVWEFEKLGKRRTQPLQGGLKGSEPFHWSGDMSDFPQLVGEVFTHRMGGPQASPDQASALLDWIDTVPSLPKPKSLDAEAELRGKTLFESKDVGCADCHSGARLSNNTTSNVGTGESLQVPTLRGLTYRAPFLHNGCAPTLHDRFGSCGGGDAHGRTSHLSPDQVSDLVAYLESL